MKRRKSKCKECRYKDAKPAHRSHDELSYARCTTPAEFPCHLEEGDTMCRGHWELYKAAEKKNIEADEAAGDRIIIF